MLKIKVTVPVEVELLMVGVEAGLDPLTVAMVYAHTFVRNSIDSAKTGLNFPDHVIDDFDVKFTGVTAKYK